MGTYLLFRFASSLAVGLRSLQRPPPQPEMSARRIWYLRAPETTAWIPAGALAQHEVELVLRSISVCEVLAPSYARVLMALWAARCTR
jgi:hypothetical protein